MCWQMPLVVRALHESCDGVGAGVGAGASLTGSLKEIERRSKNNTVASNVIFTGNVGGHEA